MNVGRKLRGKKQRKRHFCIW